MRPLPRAFGALALSLAAACGDADVPSLVGQWLITGYESDGVVATAVSGTADFQANGTLVFNALITFPGEPQDTIVASYTWTQDGDALTMTDAVDTSSWTITSRSDGQVVVLALQGDASASKLTLTRP